MMPRSPATGHRADERCSRKPLEAGQGPRLNGSIAGRRDIAQPRVTARRLKAEYLSPRMRACLANERWIRTNKSNTCKGGIIPKWPCRYHAAFKQTRQDKTRQEGFRLPRLSFPSLCRECGGWGLTARGSGSVRLRYKRHWTSKADADASGWAFRPRPLAAISSLRSLASTPQSCGRLGAMRRPRSQPCGPPPLRAVTARTHDNRHA
jgi:hypothetical protein